MTKPKGIPFRRGDNALERLLAERYGYAAEAAPAAVVVMAAEYLMWTATAPVAQRQLAEVNDRRAAAGVAPARPAPGHPLGWKGER